MPSSKPASPGQTCALRPCTDATVDRAAREPRAAQLRRARRSGRAGSRRRSGSRTSCRTRSRRSPGASGRGRAGSWARTPPRRAARPSRARGPARSTRAGAGRLRSWTGPGTRTGCVLAGLSVEVARRDAGVDAQLGRRRRQVWSTPRPRARANSRMPLTELWLSNVSRKRSPARNGYASATSRSAPVALAVKITSYSSGEAPEDPSTAARARSIASAVAAEVGLIECGLPNTRGRAGRGARAAASSRTGRRPCSRGTRDRLDPGA